MIDLYRSDLETYTFDSSYINRLKNKKSFPYIFHDNINYIRSLYNSGKARPITYDNVQKTILCGSLFLGYDIYECPTCGNESFIPHSCHSRFCTKCATKEAKLRSAYISSMALAVASLHTFGRNLQWNPHIHLLVCEEGFDKKNNKLKSFSYMSYKKLRHTWMYEVLNILEPKLGKDFYQLKQELYQNYPDGFYVYDPPLPEDLDSDDIEGLVSYMTRYTSRPPMAENRIVEYNPSTKQIHWYYNRHQDEERVDVKEHVHSFLNKLLLHCSEKNFKMVRYYGFYSNRNKPTLDTIYEVLGNKKKKRKKSWKEVKQKIKEKKKKLLYRNHMIDSFQVDPILCKCGVIMVYLESYNPFVDGQINDRK